MTELEFILMLLDGREYLSVCPLDSSGAAIKAEATRDHALIARWHAAGRKTACLGISLKEKPDV